MKEMATTDAQITVTIENRLIALTRNGKTTILAPNGQNASYI